MSESRAAKRKRSAVEKGNSTTTRRKKRRWGGRREAALPSGLFFSKTMGEIPGFYQINHRQLEEKE